MDRKVKTVMARTVDTVLRGDMVVIDGTPHLVWEWTGDEPTRTTRLDPRYLQTDPAHLPPGIDAVYGQEVADPRGVH